MSRPKPRNKMLRDLETADHAVSCAEWACLLCQLDPAEHWDRRAERPTSASPGSPTKIAAMQERYHLGQSLCHPLDRLDQESPRCPTA